MAKYKVRFSVVKEFEADNRDKAWEELKIFCEDNDCYMPHIVSDWQKIEEDPSQS